MPSCPAWNMSSIILIKAAVELKHWEISDCASGIIVLAYRYGPSCRFKMLGRILIGFRSDKYEG